MCGRYSISSPVDDLRELFEFEGLMPNLAPSYNVAPTQAVPVIRMEEGVRRLAFVRWGLVPSWAKEIGEKPLINARSESVAEKPSFRASYRRRRCLVPADGFYEWQAREGTLKQPHNIELAEGGPFAMAGVWDDWLGADGTELDSLAILTTTANETLKPIHHRMPVILQPSDYKTWLDMNEEMKVINELLTPAPDTMLKSYPVSTRVNAIVNDDKSLIEPISPQPEQGSLFD